MTQPAIKRTAHEINMQELRYERNTEEQRIEKLKKRIELAEANQRSANQLSNPRSKDLHVA
jgi:hypothetical protein